MRRTDVEWHLVKNLEALGDCRISLERFQKNRAELKRKLRGWWCNEK